MTGINAIMFYAPVLLQTMGFKSDASLLSEVINGTVNVASTFVSVYLVDKIGRRKLLLQACVQMFISQVSIGAILLTHLNTTGTMDKGLVAVVVVLGIPIDSIVERVWKQHPVWKKFMDDDGPKSQEMI
ncbi:hypothetical protein ACSBR1_031758 [Camellia fascicularis]